MQEGIMIRRAAVDDLGGILALLRANDLPVDGVADWLENFKLAVAGGRIVGAAGYELHGGYALLRSVVVDSSQRGMGTGERLVESVLTQLEDAGVRSVYLLTTTAERYFPRFGFVAGDRATVPAALNASEEFTHACPATARVMVRTVGPKTESQATSRT